MDLRSDGNYNKPDGIIKPLLTLISYFLLFLSVISPSFNEFKNSLDHGNVVPVWEEILADLDTPVSAFKKIEDGTHCFLFESVEGGEKWGQYSFIGSEVSVIFRSKGEHIEIIENGDLTRIKGDPVDELRKLLLRYRPVESPFLPRFQGGAVGYFSYDVVRFVEKLPDSTEDDLQLWDCVYVITDTIVVFDNIHNKIKIIANAFVPEKKDAECIYNSSVAKIGSIKSRLQSPLINKQPRKHNNSDKQLDLTSNFKKQAYKDAVSRTKKYIEQGDIIQSVISQRWSTELTVDPFDLYRCLRVLNPSPYMFYLKFDDQVLVGSSPEVMVRVEEGRIESRPIAGTRPRGKTQDEDLKLSQDLLSDPKERAEHIMLVDLARNDLGKIAQVGTVVVDEFMTIERYSHVMHIVSNVVARLKPGKDSFDVIKATIPAGTLSGAPKVRAMEIIDEMEPTRRGAYGGTVGYFSFSGNMDSCIVIRTFVIKNEKIYIQAGAGIVADSDPESEYCETVNKVKALVTAVEMARSGL